jgi:DNA (cytosine-5)-methyltransferase 1
MLACLNELNYDVEWRVVNAAEYGAGQKRKRIFIFCWKQNTNYSTEINKYNEKDIFLTQGMFAKAFPILEITEINSTKIPDDIIQTSDNFKFDFKNSGYMHNGIIYTTTPTPLTEESITLGSMIEKNVDNKYTVPDEKLDKWKYLKGSKKIPRKDKNGFEYMYTEGAMAFPDNLNKPARTMLTSEGTLNRTSHIILDPQTNKYRILTPVETERIQGFDDNWTEGMTDRMRRFCMGNSLVVPMITRMGKVINDIVEKEN